MSQRRFTVVWTETAANDVARIASYLADEAPHRAETILDRIVARGQSLARSPERGRTPPELRSLGDKTWREVQERPWRVVYRVVEGRVEIHAVLDGRRSLQDLLLERILDG
jgi:toxin ParE1/3/4